MLGHFQAGDYLILQNEVNCLAAIMNKAHERGMKIVLNPSPINGQISMLPLNFVDYFFVNEIEAGLLTGIKSRVAGELVPAVRRRFPETKVILTLGAEGSFYIEGETVLHQDIFRVRTVDTTAAGDTFSGYFMAGILRGKNPAEALRLASKAAALAVSRRGAAPSIPAMEEALAFRVY